MSAQPEAVNQPGGRPSVFRRELPRLLPFVIAAVLFVLFVTENSRTVRVTFLFWKVGTSLAWALIVSGALGFVAGLTLAWFRGRRRV